MTTTPGADVLVVTALQLERRAVRSHLVDFTTDSHSGLGADRGSFLVGDNAHSAVVIETGAGNVDAAALTVRAEEAVRPRIVAMVGIAGGLKDVSIGDVVASSKVYWIESGKQEEALLPRPDFAPVSPSLVQSARAIAADSRWTQRAAQHDGGPWPDGNDRTPAAFVAPIVAGEKVLADRRSDVVALTRQVFSDALAVDMEDFGTLRGARSAERTRCIAIRGVSDLVDAKAVADAMGSQPRAAANAAAFLFELLALELRTTGSAVLSIAPRELAALGAELYPQGPQQAGLWERAGGDASRLLTGTTGQSAWWHAAGLLNNGGGGSELTVKTLLDVMLGDYPQNPDLRRLSSY